MSPKTVPKLFKTQPTFFNLDDSVRRVLRQVSQVPLRTAQSIGFCIYKLDSRNELRFAWLSFPFLAMVLNVAYHLAGFSFFHSNREEFQLGPDSTTEAVTTTFVTCLYLGGQFVVHLSQILHRQQIPGFQTAVNHLLCSLLAKKESTSSSSSVITVGSQLLSLNSFGRESNRRIFAILVLTAFSCIFRVGRCASIAFDRWDESRSQAELWRFALFTLIIGAYSLLFLPYNMTLHWITMYVNLFRVALRILKLETQELSSSTKGGGGGGVVSGDDEVERRRQLLGHKLDWFFSQYRNIQRLVDELSNLFQIYILISGGCLLAMMLQETFLVLIYVQLGEWINASGSVADLAVAGFSFFTICSACTELTCEALAAVNSLQDIKLRSIPSDMHLEFCVNLHMCANNPVVVSPGKFISIHRRIIPSVLGLVTTYMIVLLQFHEKDK